MKTLLERAIKKVADDMGLPERFVDRVYKAYWKAIREHVTSIPIKSTLTDEEFKKLQPNVNIPSLGKLNVTLDRYKRLSESYNKMLEKKNAAHKEN